MDRPNFAAAQARAEFTLIEGTETSCGGGCGTCNLARAYLALLETVAPLLAAADEAVTYMDDEFAREDLALAADALRDLLGPTGGEA